MDESAENAARQQRRHHPLAANERWPKVPTTHATSDGHGHFQFPNLSRSNDRVSGNLTRFIRPHSGQTSSST
jgi:hypothetical protein